MGKDQCSLWTEDRLNFCKDAVERRTGYGACHAMGTLAKAGVSVE
jgi:hypothetical protein